MCEGNMCISFTYQNPRNSIFSAHWGLIIIVFSNTKIKIIFWNDWKSENLNTITGLEMKNLQEVCFQMMTMYI